MTNLTNPPLIERGTGWIKIHYRRDVTDEDHARISAAVQAPTKSSAGSARHLRVPVDAIVNLVNHQQQCDEDGVMVQVSRQALAEVLVYVTEVCPDNKLADTGAPAQAEQMRLATITECADFLASEYPDNANTNAFCAAIRSLAAQPPTAPVDGEKAARDYEHGYNDGVEWAQTHGHSSAVNAGEDGGDLIERLRGRALFLRNYGEQKTPELLERAADALMNVSPQTVPSPKALGEAFSDWAWEKEGDPVGLMLPHDAARVSFFAGARWALSLPRPKSKP